MTIIAILGKHNSGKTSTISQIHEALINLGCISVNKIQVQSKDIFFLEYNSSRKGVIKIAIILHGDWESLLVDSLNACQNFDLIICPTRTKGAIYKVIESYTNISNVWIKPTVQTDVIPNRIIRNNKNTLEVIEYIEKIIF